jgi:maltose O-acetyltransferase
MIGRLLRTELFLWVQAFLGAIPGVTLGVIIRRGFYRITLKSCGKKLKVFSGVHLEVPERISIGDYVGINRACWISGGGGLEIGNNVIMGPLCIIHTANHNYERMDTPIWRQGHTGKMTIIENDVWLGAGVIILPGAHIGQGAVIGAGAVVSGSINAYGIAAGVPARVLKSRGGNVSSGSVGNRERIE